MSVQPTENHYVAERSKLLKSLRKNARVMRKVSDRMSGKEFTDKAADEALREYETVILQTPCVRGTKNRLTGNLVRAAEARSMYRVVKRYGQSDEEIGKLVWRGWEGMSERYPQSLLRLYGRLQLSGFGQKMAKKMAAETQRGEYAANSVAVYVEGDGVDLGIDVLECAILKFDEAQGAARFAPYLCLFDLAMSEACGLGLRRTMTIAQGREKCDFRYGKGRETTDGWPPRFLVPNA